MPDVKFPQLHRRKMRTVDIAVTPA